MAARYRKSINLGGGLKLNVNKKSVSLTAGTRGAHYTVSSTGRRTKSVGIPGTGFSYRSTTSARQTASRSAARRSSAVSRPAPPRAASGKPGWFAPKGLKLLYAGFSQANAQAPATAWMPTLDRAAGYPKFAFPAHVIAGMYGFNSNPTWASQHLAAAYEDGRDPQADPFVARYIEIATVHVNFDGIELAIPLSRALLGISLMQYYDSHNEERRAVQVAESLPDTPECRLIRADVALAAGNPSHAVELTDGGITNADDLSAMTMAIRAAALLQLGHPDAALTAAREAGSQHTRTAAVLQRARYERGCAYQALGKLGMAKKDFETIYASDTQYRDVADRLPACTKG